MKVTTTFEPVMTSDEYIAAVGQLRNGLSDAQVASALARVVVNLCTQNGGSPVAYIKWAMSAMATGHNLGPEREKAAE
jgi:hypothetical protein